MGLMDITNVDIKEAGPSFDKFDVEKNDKALIHIPEPKVIQEFVHVFHRDEPMMTERNGRQVPTWSRESFAGSFICTGDFETVMSNPSYGDPTNCPACRAMNKSPKLVERPKRTFAMNVVRYATKPRSFDLRNNNVDVQVWRHADIRKIEPILLAAKQSGGDLSKIDFMIEADNSDWKKYMIQPKLGNPTFTENDDLKSNMKEAYDNLFDQDTLTEAIGRKLPTEALESEISRLMTEYKLEAEGDSDDGGLFVKSDDSSDSDASSDADVEDKTTSDDLQQVDENDLTSIGNSLFDE